MTRTLIDPSDVTAIRAVLVSSRQPVSVICDRWSLTLIIALLSGERRFKGLQARTGMANRLLSARLRTLESAGLLVRAPYCARPPRYEYRLTNMGADVTDVILQMARWEQNWVSPAMPGPRSITHAACGAPLRPQLRCGACGRLAGARDIELRVSRAQIQKMPIHQTTNRRSTMSSGDPDMVLQLLGPTLDIFGDKWGIEILLCAFFRIHRFGDFRQCIGISANILSDRMNRLTAAGILTRDEAPSSAAGYRLTEKGIDIYGVLVAVQAWADAWLKGRYRSPVRLVHRDCGEVFDPLTTCSACQQPVNQRDVVFQPLTVRP